MAERNLPIKFFEKRQKDQQETEGGGGGKLPAWVIKEPEKIREKSYYLRTVLDNVSETFTVKENKNNYLPTVVRLKINDEALAKSYRKDVAKLFNVGKLNIIGFDNSDELLIKIDNRDDLKKIADNLASVEKDFYAQWAAVSISAIDGIETYKPVVDVDINEGDVLKIKLFNYHDYELNNILIRAFESYCNEKGLVFERAVYSADLNVYRVVLDDALAVDELQEFDGVQLIANMPTFSVTIDEMPEDNPIVVRKPEEGVDYPVVGVLDSGISKIPHLEPWLLEEFHTNYVEADINKAHGTLVAGVLVYGDDLEGKAYTGFGDCKIFEAIVVPDLKRQKVYEDVLIEQIREAVSNNDHIKIWNLSLGTDKEADLYDFSDFAKALDEIQEHHNVLICKSTGNCENYKFNAPRGRIARAADSVRSIVVGSIAQDKLPTDLVEKHFPSPFTRVGPGPSHLIKPDVVHIGGNAGLDARGNVVINPVKSFSVDGLIARIIGTSFSTPRVTAITAGVDHMLNEPFNPILLKALIIHSSKYPPEMQMEIAEKMRMAGFGLPANVNDILFNNPNEITLILQDTLERGSFINIMDFPYPQSMVDEEGYYYGEITITLVTSPVLDVSQGAEYCQSNMDIMFGSYDEKVERDITLPHIKNPIKPDGSRNLLNEGIYSKRVTKQLDNVFNKERVLLTYGKKYQPIKKWVVNLDELTDTNRENFLKAPKQWYLKLQGVYRDFTETKAELQNIEPSQEFCLLITIRDIKKKGNIYNEVTRLLDANSFIHKNITLKNQIQVRLNNNTK